MIMLTKVDNKLVFLTPLSQKEINKLLVLIEINEYKLIKIKTLYIGRICFI